MCIQLSLSVTIDHFKLELPITHPVTNFPSWKNASILRIITRRRVCHHQDIFFVCATSVTLSPVGKIVCLTTTIPVAGQHLSFVCMSWNLTWCRKFGTLTYLTDVALLEVWMLACTARPVSTAHFLLRLVLRAENTQNKLL